MAGIYYPEAADWLRAVGVNVVEDDDWETRARSSGGFGAPPLGVQWHHTASSGQHPLNDIRYMTRTAEFRPVGNIYLAPNGVAYMLAAGAANTAGKGGPWKMSRGTVPANSGNTTTWALEVANNGVGQIWPQVQIDAFFKISNELNKRWGNQPTDLFTHAAYAPGRKIDPATAEAVQGPWKPRATNAQGSWSVDDVKAEAARRGGTKPPTPTPPPPVIEPEGAVMYAAIMKYGGTASKDWGGWFSQDGCVTRQRVKDGHHAKLLVALGAVDAATCTVVTDPGWSGVSHTLSESDLNAYLGVPR